MTVKPNANPVGRPSLYKESYCDEVISVCSEGLSLTAFAGVIGVSRDIISDWMKAHPEFRLACSKAMAKRTLFLEKGLISAESTSPMVTARRFALVNAHVGNGEHDWREQQEVKHSGSIDTSSKEQRDAAVAAAARAQR